MACRSTVVIALATAVTVLFALSPSGATGAKPCSARPNARPCADKTAPTTPGNLAVTGTTATTVTVSWTASSDDVGVTGYTLFRDGGTVTTTTSTGFTYTGLSCATSYVFAVDAYDAAANRSAQASVATSTAACPTDTTPPSTPTGLKQTGSTQTGVSLAWNASTDNIGVTRYNVFRGGAPDYFSYFGSQAPAAYYSYDVGTWHVVSLASSAGISPSAGGAEETWLKQDLAAHPSKCLLAYWHEPRWSSGTTHGSSSSWGAVWNDLYGAGADVVLNGHEHNYERFAKQTP